ncbi:hypothetical protein [Streptomyces cyaneofuscatus]|uniref:hypothetical protein n=1 Tax=Streptomyces cyaneofuscatus TaxID=66883 RepID=UPI00382FA2E6
MLTQLKKSEYGAAVAEHMTSGRFTDVPGFKKAEGLLFQVKQKGMIPAVHQAMEHAAELQAKGVKGIEFEVKIPGENLDLDVLMTGPSPSIRPMPPSLEEFADHADARAQRDRLVVLESGGRRGARYGVRAHDCGAYERGAGEARPAGAVLT